MGERGTRATRHAPASGSAEAREETIERAVDRSRQVLAAEDRGDPAVTTVEDPSTRRNLNARLAKAAALGVVVGVVLGIVVGIVFQAWASPLAIEGVVEQTLYLGVFALGFGAAGVVVASLVVLGREDGRVSEDVERAGGRQSAEVGAHRRTT